MDDTPEFSTRNEIHHHETFIAGKLGIDQTHNVRMMQTSDSGNFTFNVVIVRLSILFQLLNLEGKDFVSFGPLGQPDLAVFSFSNNLDFLKIINSHDIIVKGSCQFGSSLHGGTTRQSQFIAAILCRVGRIVIGLEIQYQSTRLDSETTTNDIVQCSHCVSSWNNIFLTQQDIVTKVHIFLDCLFIFSLADRNVDGTIADQIQGWFNVFFLGKDFFAFNELYFDHLFCQTDELEGIQSKILDDFNVAQQLSVICLENDIVKATQHLVESRSINTKDCTFFFRKDTILTRRVPRQGILPKIIPRLNYDIFKGSVSHNNIGSSHFSALQDIKGISFAILLVQVFSLGYHPRNHEVTETLQIIIEQIVQKVNISQQLKLLLPNLLGTVLSNKLEGLLVHSVQGGVFGGRDSGRARSRIQECRFSKGMPPFAPSNNLAIRIELDFTFGQNIKVIAHITLLENIFSLFVFHHFKGCQKQTKGFLFQILKDKVSLERVLEKVVFFPCLFKDWYFKVLARIQSLTNSASSLLDGFVFILRFAHGFHTFLMPSHTFLPSLFLFFNGPKGSRPSGIGSIGSSGSGALLGTTTTVIVIIETHFTIFLSIVIVIETHFTKVLSIIIIIIIIATETHFAIVLSLIIIIIITTVESHFTKLTIILFVLLLDSHVL
mmetsp:Transcript_46118/g.111735  ORF Transcript_46118/g.111735 Transcript_46118/m.111735 type:complete len:662 (-) Transcript_46118:888-2873(-)